MSQSRKSIHYIRAVLATYISTTVTDCLPGPRDVNAGARTRHTARTSGYPSRGSVMTSLEHTMAPRETGAPAGRRDGHARPRTVPTATRSRLNHTYAVPLIHPPRLIYAVLQPHPPPPSRAHAARHSGPLRRATTSTRPQTSMHTSRILHVSKLGFTANLQANEDSRMVTTYEENEPNDSDTDRGCFAPSDRTSSSTRIQRRERLASWSERADGRHAAVSAVRRRNPAEVLTTVPVSSMHEVNDGIRTGERTLLLQCDLRGSVSLHGDKLDVS